MTAPTDAPVEERHRRAAWTFEYGDREPGLLIIQKWFRCGAESPLASLDRIAQVIANAERDGYVRKEQEHDKLFEDVEAEVEVLRAYRRAWERVTDAAKRHAEKTGDKVMFDRLDLASILAEELARKGTP